MRFRPAGQKKELNKRRANLSSLKEQADQQQKQADKGRGARQRFQASSRGRAPESWATV